MKIYITKYALTKGILVAESDKFSENMAVVKINGTSTYFFGKDWHQSLEEAKVKYSQMITVKLRSIERQKKKLLETIPDRLTEDDLKKLN